MSAPRSPRARADAAVLTLYVAGRTPASRQARINLASILSEMGLSLEPTFIDVLAAPEEAMRQRVFVTPALVVQCDGARQLVVGDLSLREPVAALLRALPRKGVSNE